MAKMLEDAGAVRRFAFAACVDVVVDGVAERLRDALRGLRLVLAKAVDSVDQAVEDAALGIMLRGRFVPFVDHVLHIGIPSRNRHGINQSSTSRPFSRTY